jgi:tRNA-2-methylthio-N6-dimethylallyladenosine synthase
LYTVEEYREMLSRIRETVPDAAVTSDFIVGFCGETETDFEATKDLVRHARFKNSYIFKYSAREGTKAFDLHADDVDDETKRRRNNELLAIQNQISEEDNQPLIGRTVRVLVEGPSKAGRKHEGAAPGDETPDDASTGMQSAAAQLTGRDACDRIVVFDGPKRLIGQWLDVTIYDANAFTLFGSVATSHVGPEVYSL